MAVLGLSERFTLSERVDSLPSLTGEAKVVVMSALDWQVDLMTLSFLPGSAVIVCEVYSNLP